MNRFPYLRLINGWQRIKRSPDGFEDVLGSPYWYFDRYIDRGASPFTGTQTPGGASWTYLPWSEVTIVTTTTEATTQATTVPTTEGTYTPTMSIQFDMGARFLWEYSNMAEDVGEYSKARYGIYEGTASTYTSSTKNSITLQVSVDGGSTYTPHVIALVPSVDFSYYYNGGGENPHQWVARTGSVSVRKETIRLTPRPTSNWGPLHVIMPPFCHVVNLPNGSGSRIVEVPQKTFQVSNDSPISTSFEIRNDPVDDNSPKWLLMGSGDAFYSTSPATDNLYAEHPFNFLRPENIYKYATGEI